jgi:hypothetical protein
MEIVTSAISTIAALNALLSAIAIGMAMIVEKTKNGV